MKFKLKPVTLEIWKSRGWKVENLSDAHIKLNKAHDKPDIESLWKN